VFRGQFDPANQIHDFNPGSDNGLFWTVPIPGGAVFADIHRAQAHLIVDDLDGEDYHDVVNAILDGPSLEANVSFKAHWHGVRHRRHVHNTEHRFDLHAVQTRATLEWTGRSGSVVYRSDPAETSRTEFAELAFERNGSYFS
jgi:hypothetical protein